MDYEKTLEFIGEARAGISRERFSLYGVQYAEELINLASASGEAHAFLRQREINEDYAVRNARDMLYRLHFNRFNDYYLALGLPHTASDQQINRRWKDLMLIYHPDRIKGDDPQAYECATRINEVYAVLKDPRSRADYDRRLTRPATDVSRMASARPPQRNVQPQKVRRLSPNIRKALARMVIPLSIAVSCLFLLFVYLQNRPVGSGGDYLSKSPSVESMGEATRKGVEARKQIPETAALPAKELPNAVAPEVLPQTGSPPQKSPGTGSQEPSPQPRERPAPVAPKEPSKATSQAVSPKEIPSAPVAAAPPLSPSKKGAASAERTSPKVEDRKTSGAAKSVPPGKTETAKPTVVASAQGAQVETRKVEETPTPVRDTTPAPSPQAAVKKPEPSAKPVPEAASPRIASPGVDAPQEAKEETRPEPVSAGVDEFVANYTRAYNMGDVNAFVSLYSASAIENNKLNYSQIRQVYTKHLEGNRFSYVLKNYRYSRRDDAVILTGTYSVRKISGGSEPFSMNGSITWTLKSEKNVLKIVKVEYSKGQ